MDDSAMDPTTDPTARFHHAAEAALGNERQRANYRGALRTVRGRRDALFAQLTDGEELQRIGNAVKQASLARLPELLEQLEARLTERGIQVHWAETTDEANHIVLEIAQRNAVRSVVKGKSMVSEEMELNHFLTEHGIEALEADLGEFIVQLAGQTPCHIVVPAVYLDRTEIAQLFQQRLGEPYTDDPAELTAIARRILREKYQTADMGI